MDRRLISRALKDTTDGKFAFDMLKNRFAREGWHKRLQVLIEFDQVMRDEARPSNHEIALRRSRSLMQLDRDLSDR